MENKWRNISFGPSLKELDLAIEKNTPVSFIDEKSGETLSVLIETKDDVFRPEVVRFHIIGKLSKSDLPIEIYYTPDFHRGMYLS